jgi:hypothetical protein
LPRFATVHDRASGTRQARRTFPCRRNGAAPFLEGAIHDLAFVYPNRPFAGEQRITDLKAALKITPDQETKWKAVADAMRQNAGAMDKLVQDKRAKAASMTAVDDLETYQDFTKAHLDGLKNLTSAFKSLYDSMPADQKKNADQVFQAFGPSSKSPNQG